MRKGLEFPVVILANLAKGSGGSSDPIRIVSPAFRDGDEGEPSVAIGEHQSDADRDAEAREAEESKRLLYVAMTRARDRLYLAATVDRSGRFAPLKGSLGRVLPAAIGDAITAAAAEPSIGDRVWVGPSAVHRVSLIRPPTGEPRMLPPPLATSAPADDFTPLPAPALRAGATAGDLRALSSFESGDEDADISFRRADGTMVRAVITRHPVNSNR